jgi:hypothetical protein
MAGQAGTHLDLAPMDSRAKWTPAFAGVTKIVVDQSFLRACFDTVFVFFNTLV